MKQIDDFELEVLRLILKYPSAKVLSQPLFHYMLSELKIIHFTNPIYRSVFESLYQLFLDRQSFNANYFIESENYEHRDLVRNLISRNYTESLHWGNKYVVQIPDDHELIDRLAIMNVNMMNRLLINRMISEQKIKPN